MSGVLVGSDPALENELQALELEVADQVNSGMWAFKLKVGEDHERDLSRVRLARRIALDKDKLTLLWAG